MEVESVSGGGVATIKGTITGSPSSGDAVTVIYPASAADGTTGNIRDFGDENQDGTLTYISKKCDVRKGSGTLKVDGDGASLDGDVLLANQFCIFKMTLKDIDATNSIPVNVLEVYDADNNRIAMVVDGSDTFSECYIAIPTTSSTLKFYAYEFGSGFYGNKKTGLSLGPNYYQSTLKLATTGDVILSDGKFAKPGTSGAVAMITTFDPGYKPASSPNVDVSGNWFGLAIALEDAYSGSGIAWSDATEAAGVSSSTDFVDHTSFNTGIDDTDKLAAMYAGYAAYQASTYTVSGFNPASYGFSNWFLPSSSQFAQFLYNAGAAVPTAWDTYSSGGAADVTAVNGLLTAAGGNAFDAQSYWTSSEYDNADAVTVTLDATNGIKLSHDGKTGTLLVRPFIAF